MAEEKQEELTEEAKLAQEAETPETPAEEPEVKEESENDFFKQQIRDKDAVIGEFRRGLRDTRQELAEVKAQQAAKDTPTKSPVELAREQADQLGIRLEFTTELYESQRKFEDGQTTAKSEQEVYARQNREYQAGLAVLDQNELNSLIAQAGHLMTDHEERFIFHSGRNSGKELKRILTEHIEAKKEVPQPKVEPTKEKTDKSKAEVKEEKETPSQEEILLDKQYETLTFAQ